MKNWSALFIRQGFRLEEVKENVLDCSLERKENVAFLQESLSKGNIKFQYVAPFLTLESELLLENQWIKLVDFEGRGHGEGLYFKAETEEPKVFEIDTYISGIVRELNRLGLYTCGSCDGHNRRSAAIYLLKEEDIDVTTKVLLAAGIKRITSRGRQLRILVTKREQLLAAAETLHLIQREWLSEGIDFFQRQFFYILLERLLSINGKSGEEEVVRQFVIEQLKGFVDYLTVDKYGNVLA